MSPKRISQWNPNLAQPSQAGSELHARYFARNAEAPPVAVLVFHGIGEEVRFETLSRAASLLLVEAEERGASNIEVVIRSVPKDKDATSLEVRAELSWREKDGTPRQAHVYEAYWAPLTAGKVSYWETMGFLVSAGWNGLRGTLFSGNIGSFQRWLFGGFKELKTRPATGFLLLLLMGMIGFIAAVIAMAAAAAAGVAKQIGDGGKAGLIHAANYVYSQIAVSWNWCARSVGWLLAHIHIWPNAPDWANQIAFLPGLSRQHWGQALLAFAIWVGLIATAFWFRSLLTAYAGSLVAYLSPYKDSKFEDLRRQVQQVGQGAANLIYEGYRLPSGWIPKYEKVVLLGHSLGSVIAYDTLNGLINMEAARNPRGAPNAVVERTRALITFGSPLNKTAFLFRVQFKMRRGRLDQEGELRETMVSAVQPLIASYTDYRFNRTAPPHRPKWINLWSHMDIISGHLDYYDDPAVDQSAPEHVQNLIDPDAWIPIAAHNQYWTKKLLRKTVYGELF